MCAFTAMRIPDWHAHMVLFGLIREKCESMPRPGIPHKLCALLLPGSSSVPGTTRAAGSGSDAAFRVVLPPARHALPSPALRYLAAVRPAQPHSRTARPHSAAAQLSRTAQPHSRLRRAAALCGGRIGGARGVAVLAQCAWHCIVSLQCVFLVLLQTGEK